MKFTTLFELIKAHADDADACALAVVKSAKGSSPRELLDAFSVALGTGRLNPPFARALLAAVERFQYDPALCASAAEEDPGLAALRREVDELSARREELVRRDGALADQREKARRAGRAFEEARARRDALAAEVAGLREQCQRAVTPPAEEAS